MLRCVLIVVCTYFFSMLGMAQMNFNLELKASIPQGNILTNDVWGYVDASGREYAIVGTRAEAIIYDISDPVNPIEVKRVPGASSIWRDFKVYKDYIYQTTDQGTDGLRIIDMTMAPDSISTTTWTERVELPGRTDNLRTCHNLWIDTLTGRAFLAGCNVGNGGALVLDIATDPLQPKVIGAVNEAYAHDVITRGNFLYASEINQGNLGIYDISDIQDPILLSRTPTTSNFTHNAWYSDDGNFIFTTDERPNSFVDAYDISDPTSPKRVDSYQPKADAGIIPHNVHYLNGYIIVSWYSEGIIILDAHRPHNLIKVGQYDTAPNSTTGSDGCWGAYPYFPSGTIIGSDISTGFFVLEPNYQRASYLEGSIVDDRSSEAINLATITLLTSEVVTDVSDASGTFATGSADQGSYQVIVSHPEYRPDTITITLTNGEVTDLNVRLRKKASITLSGSVSDQQGRPIAGAVILLQSDENQYVAISEALGTWSATIFEEDYRLSAAAWGYSGVTQEVTSTRPINLKLEAGYEDDFFADLGWTVESDALSGIWERGNPIGTFFGSDAANPGADLPTDLGSQCYITGNGGGNAGFDDVDNGTTTLISPPIPNDAYISPTIEVAAWFNNTGGNTPLNDTLQVFIRRDGHDTLIANVLNEENQGGRWRELAFELDESFFAASASGSFQVLFKASDLIPDGHLVEAGIDAFRVVEGATTSTSDPSISNIDIILSPNPVSDRLFFTSDQELDIRGIKVFDAVGRVVLDQRGTLNYIDVSTLQSSAYFLQIALEDQLIIKPFSKL